MAKSKKTAAKNKRPSATTTAAAASKDATKAVDTVAAKTEAPKAAASSASTAASASKAAAVTPAAEKTVANKTPADKTSAPAETPKPKAAEPSKAATAKTEVSKPAAAKPSETPKRDVAPAAPTPAPAPQQKRGGFIPLVLGGLIAGGIGFAAAEYQWLTTRDTNDQSSADIAANAAQITANADRITAVEGAEVDLSSVDDLASKTDDLSSKVADLSTTLADIDARLTTVEERPAPDGGPSIADQTAFEKELQALKASAEEQRAEIATLLENAQNVEQATAAAAQTAQVQSAVSQITAALGSGQPFADTLTSLTDNGVEVPAALTDVATDGVATLTNLQSRFPDTARAALGVARTSGAMEGESGFGGFLKRQLGARSTQPREGSDPDAVLSRVEAAVRDGGLDTALTEIDTLPEDVQSAMQDWLDDARARSAAETATQDLSQSLPAN